MSKVQKIGAVVVALVVAFLVALGFHWTVNRVYVSEGHSLRLRYKGPLIFGPKVYTEAGYFAKEGEIGVLEEMRGPGRHFYCPIWWEREVVPDQVVRPGQIAVVTGKMGTKLPVGEFLVDFFEEDGETIKKDGQLGETRHKGVLRKVFGPGRYRVNTYAYEFQIMDTQRDEVGNQTKLSGWVEIPTGYVGVVTYLTEDSYLKKTKGIQDDVMPPGVYWVNPLERQIDIVEIGYREISISVDQQQGADGSVVYDESGEPLAVPDTGISFPSNDGFKIQMDFTAVWGVMPEQAPQIVRTFGNVNQVEQKVILPQSESICRNNGSKMGAVDLLVGDSRQEFQLQTSMEFQGVLKEKNVTLLYGLVRHIYIPQEIRIPIQNGYIADELKLTREQERDTARTEAKLREEEKKVDLESEKIRVETTKLVAAAIAEGEKKAGEIEAETEQLVAVIDRKIAELEAQQQVLVGQAEASAEQMSEEAKADKFRLAIEAFGDGAAYTKWQFAEGLPDTIDMKMLYAGEGTLWTDLKNIVPTLPLRGQK
jgi:regulator of protease activity HflC (stomatin/prohibitin superfamily)